MHLVDVTMFWSAQGGGVRSYLRAKHAFLQQQGSLQHTIVVPGAFNAAPPEVPGIPLPFSAGYRLPRDRASAYRVLSELAPDLIEAGDPYQLAWTALRAGRALDVPVAAFYHSDLTELVGRTLGRYAQDMAKNYVKRLYKHFDLVFAPSRYIAARLDDLGVQRVALQPLGVNTSRFSPQHRDEQWRIAQGLPADARVLLYVGRYAPEKNLHALTDAVAKLGPPYVLVTIGGGKHPPCGAQVLACPYELNAASLAKAYASADVFVHAGDQETFGLAMLEALASGVPGIGCAKGGIAELIDQSVGAAVPHCTADAFAEAISAVFAGDRVAMGAQARQRALSYDWNTVLMPLEDHYLQLLRAQLRTDYADRRAA